MENKSNIMSFKKFLKYLNINESSFKETRLNQILDKMNKGLKISKREQKFLNRYDKTTDEDFKDYKMMTKDSTFTKILELLELNIKIVCNLVDRNGKISLPITSIYNNYELGKTFMTLSNGEEIELKDNFFYELNYDFDKDFYSLEEVDEFYEKIPVEK
jgi:hypothetical protein